MSITAKADNAFNLDGELDDRVVRPKGNTRTWSLYGSDSNELGH